MLRKHRVKRVDKAASEKSGKRVWKFLKMQEDFGSGTPPPVFCQRVQKFMKRKGIEFCTPQKSSEEYERNEVR
jgi:hypothetical protein